ncbi:hypothetical protein JMUB7533_26910 [Staphylococcus aureus]
MFTLFKIKVCNVSLCHDNRRNICLLYTSDAADEARSVDLGGRRIIKKKSQWQ